MLVESVWNRLEVDGDVEERGLFATGVETFGGVADLDCMASIAGETTSLATDAARGPRRPVFQAGISTLSNWTHFPWFFLSAWKAAQALTMYA